MRATGIVRRIDELGRVVIPKEIRRTLRIREGDPQQTALEGDAQEDAQMLLALLAGVIEQRKNMRESEKPNDRARLAEAALFQ